MPAMNKQFRKKYIQEYTKNKEALVAVSNERQLPLSFGILPSPFSTWILT